MGHYKQGYSDRKDESLGMKDGKESGMKQSYKDRRDESYGMSKSKNHTSKGMGSMKVMGHDKTPYKITVPEGQGFAEIKPFRRGNLGYPSQAFDYKY